MEEETGTVKMNPPIIGIFRFSVSDVPAGDKMPRRVRNQSVLFFVLFAFGGNSHCRSKRREH